MTMRSRSDVSPATSFVRPTVRREPAGEPVPYRGYLLVPMRETVQNADAPDGRTRSRWDVLEQVQIEGQPTLVNRVKTCASQITAEGWVDAFGEPTDGVPTPIDDAEGDDDGDEADGDA